MITEPTRKHDIGVAFLILISPFDANFLLASRFGNRTGGSATHSIWTRRYRINEQKKTAMKQNNRSN